MYRYISVFILSIGALCHFQADVAARILENWPYKRLFKESDLIVLAIAMSTEKSGEVFEQKVWPLEFLGLNTTFEVKHVINGKAPNKQIKVLHYKFGQFRKEFKDCSVQTQIVDGPLFIGFRTKPVPVKGTRTMIEVPRPEYMLFLRKLKDGRYEPVSGKVDPQLSVRELFEPLSEELGGSQRD